MPINNDRIRNVLANIPQIVKSFNYVANAPTQFFQRDTFPAMVARVKVKGRKTPYKVELESRFNPALNPKTGERGRHEARLFLNLLAQKRIRDKTLMPHYNGMLVWCAAKIVTSRARSLEGALMSLAFDALEADGKLESLVIRDTTYTRDDILAKRDELLLNLQVGIDAGTIKPVSGGKSPLVESDITL
jgi:hypothetical protein